MLLFLLPSPGLNLINGTSTPIGGVDTTGPSLGFLIGGYPCVPPLSPGTISHPSCLLQTNFCL